MKQIKFCKYDTEILIKARRLLFDVFIVTYKPSSRKAALLNTIISKLDRLINEYGTNNEADVKTVVHASWIGTEFDGYADGYPVYNVFECSNCNKEHYGEEDTLTAYCPHCGAKMNAKEEEE